MYIGETDKRALFALAGGFEVAEELAFAARHCTKSTIYILLLLFAKEILSRKSLGLSLEYQSIFPINYLLVI
ncbi:hypothetical protein [Ureibacillus manganicus]|uniref:hypothetical protein n=1 Tax=Ureibacillus manganicus TaxID=1266064 RepID=UPI000B1117EC|nr:hypothetical protein [Ureibacillus manganicus]